MNQGPAQRNVGRCETFSPAYIPARLVYGNVPRLETLMSARGIVLAVTAAGLAAACRPAEPAVQPAEQAQTAPLYRRLGGYDALAAVTDDFLARLLGDPKMAPYFENVDDAGTKRIRQMIVDQLCAATGGPCFYAGADMPTAHKDLQISDRAFDVAAEYLGQSLEKFQVTGSDRAELLRIVASTRPEIVGR